MNFSVNAADLWQRFYKSIVEPVKQINRKRATRVVYPTVHRYFPYLHPLQCFIWLFKEQVSEN